MVDISLPIVVGAAVIDSINPCAFGVLIFMLAYLAQSVKTKGMMLTHGLLYILAVFMTYLIAGLFLLPIINHLGKASVVAYLVIAAVIIIAGLIEIKDFFWYGKWFSLGIIPSEAERIKMYVKKIGDKPSTAFLLGIFVALVELPCTGAVYIAILSLMSLAGVTTGNVMFLILYNIIFVLPLAAILIAVIQGTSTNKFEKWRQKYKGTMRLLIGLTLLGLGIWMISFIL
jgi:cytochrome c biogenesis protein CcdA